MIERSDKNGLVFYLLLWLLGLLFTLVKGRLSALIGLEFIVPDLLTALILYIFLLYGQTGSCMFALGQGLFVDLFSGGMQGIFSFLYLIVFGGIFLCSRFFNLHSPRGQVAIVGLVMLLKSVFFSLILMVFSQHTILSGSFPWVSVLVALITGMIAPPSFYLFDILKSFRFDKE